MRKLRLWVAAAVLVALATATVAVARGTGTTHTDTNGATFTLTQREVKNATCAGEDGQYRQYRATYSGTSTSGDPRYAGTLSLKVSGLINTTDDRGIVTGSFLLRDTTGKRWTGGKLFSVYRVGELHGVLVGHVLDRAGSPVEESSGSGFLVANFKAAYPLAGATITGSFGGIGANNRTPAAVQGGGCGLDRDDDHDSRKSKGRKGKDDRKHRRGDD
jgi:hypothetical protein